MSPNLTFAVARVKFGHGDGLAYCFALQISCGVGVDAGFCLQMSLLQGKLVSNAVKCWSEGVFDCLRAIFLSRHCIGLQFCAIICMRLWSVVKFCVVLALYMHGISHKKLSMVDFCPHKHRLVGEQRKFGLFLSGCSHKEGQRHGLSSPLVILRHGFDLTELCEGGKPLLALVVPCSLSVAKSNLVDSASSHTLVSKTKPCKSKYKSFTLKLRMAHYISYSLFDSPSLLG